jgi:hypothetical protein
MVLGMGSVVMKGSSRMSSRVGLLEGSRIKILSMSLRAFSEMVT